MSVIAYFRITKARAGVILNEVAYSVENWRATGQRTGMSDDELEPFVDPLSTPNATLRRSLSEDQSRQVPRWLCRHRPFWTSADRAGHLRRILAGRAWRDCGIRPNRRSCLRSSSQ